MNTIELSQILSSFNIDANEASFQPITHGYINDTFLISVNKNPIYILQRINQNVFQNVEKLQANIDLALNKLHSNDYARIEFLKTKLDTSLAYINNDIWRLMKYIENSQTFNTTTNTIVAFEAGKIIGNFHKLLNTEIAENYDVTIPNFHDLPKRKEQFFEALHNANEAKKNKAQNQIQFALNTFSEFTDFYADKLPLRVCHNDTKLNNILFNMDLKGLCLIDLDTLMIGHFHYDFGDAVRTLVNKTDEDEKDLTKVNFNETLFEAFIKGLKNSNLQLTEKEIQFLPIAAALMPFLHGLRTLTDFLNNNQYYKVRYPEQNLDRCNVLFRCTQLALEKQKFMMQSIDRILYKKTQH